MSVFGADMVDALSDGNIPWSRLGGATILVTGAMAGEDLRLHTEGRSRGNYCDTIDAARGLLTVMLKGKDGEAYNIANPAASATIREMAERVANKIRGGAIKVIVDVPIDIGKRGYAPDAGFHAQRRQIESPGVDAEIWPRRNVSAHVGGLAGAVSLSGEVLSTAARVRKRFGPGWRKARHGG